MSTQDINKFLRTASPTFCEWRDDYFFVEFKDGSQALITAEGDEEHIELEVDLRCIHLFEDYVNNPDVKYSVKKCKKCVA